MRTKCRWIATFHRPIHSHWSLPLSPAMGARNQVGIGSSYRPANLCSLATQFQTRFLESIPRPITGLKIPTLLIRSTCTDHREQIYLLLISQYSYLLRVYVCTVQCTRILIICTFINTGSNILINLLNTQIGCKISKVYANLSDCKLLYKTHLNISKYS